MYVYMPQRYVCMRVCFSYVCVSVSEEYVCTCECESECVRVLASVHLGLSQALIGDNRIRVSSICVGQPA